MTTTTMPSPDAIVGDALRALDMALIEWMPMDRICRWR